MERIAVILAAGKGSRMRSTLPKVLHPLAGRPLLAHVLATAQQVSQKQCLVVGHQAAQVQAAFANTDNLLWVQQDPPLGTGHALMQALPQLPQDSLITVLYGDVPLLRPETLQAMQALWQPKALVLLTAQLANPYGYGRILRDDNGTIIGIVEQKDATVAQQAIQEVNTGIMLAQASDFAAWLAQITPNNAQGEYYLTDVVAVARAKGQLIQALTLSDGEEMLGVNDRLQLQTLERMYQRKQAEKLCLQGVTIADVARLDIRGDITIAQDVFLDVNVILEGQVTLASGVTIGANCYLKNCELAENVEVLPFSHLDGVKAAAGTRIGPFARLRPGTVLAEKVHIGNFVEVKNASIANGSKVNHLSYVGDATIGRSVNIGAGTITCNYDGANKHHTHIEDQVFIGSNSALIAPVSIGEGATIGAGSVITKDAPAQQLTLARSRQVSLPQWRRPEKLSVAKAKSDSPPAHEG
jgi:bifunctional UDP-N-acetylglucosamine pyrophosphorylase/glucosamine-1-phosphate N-acetyltransferase